MDALPIKPAAPHRPPARAPASGAGKRPATPDDLAALAQQSQFDQIAAMQAEQQREFNALRDLAMQQVKRDDQTMNAWIKLI